MPRDLHGVVAVILATGVAVTVVVLALETTTHSGAISESEANVLSTVVGAIIGAVATYLGISRSNGKGTP